MPSAIPPGPQSADHLTAEAERLLYLEGIRLFNEHRFFHAHEVWEDAWRSSVGIKREFLQGLIQCAVALEHYRRGNPRGVLSLFKTYERHFSSVPPMFLGVDIGEFRRAMRTALAPVLDAEPQAQRGDITLDLSRVPQLKLLADPTDDR